MTDRQKILGDWVSAIETRLHSGTRYRIMKKWDGVHSEVERDHASMSDANERINYLIATNQLPHTEGENREYYILAQ